MTVPQEYLFSQSLFNPVTGQGDNVSVDDTDQNNIQLLSDSQIIGRTSLGFLETNSIVDTNIIYTESDQTLIQQWLDETNNPLGTEKFGIETNVALYDSDQNVSTFSDIHSVSLYSVTDVNGNLLDLGSIQATFDARTANIESSLNVWGKIDFYLDDNPVGSKYIWGSASNTNQIKLSVVDNLEFEFEPNPGAYIAIATQQSKVNSLNAELDRRVGNQSNTGRFVPDTSIPGLRDQITSETAKLNVLQNSQGSDIKRAFAPSFSQQEKKNFTFNLIDEHCGGDGDNCIYRVVLSEIHANADSTSDFKEFNWVGQHVAYELLVTVDGAKKVVLQDDENGIPKAVQIFKSDNTLKLCGQAIFQHPSHPYNPFTQVASPPRVIVTDADGNVIVDAGHGVTGPGNSSYANCSTFTGLPRGAEITFTVSNMDYTVTTPEHQVNYILNASLDGGSQSCKSLSTSWKQFRGCATIYSPTNHSNFGFGVPI